MLVSLHACKIGEDYSRKEQNIPVVYRHTFSQDSSIANLPWWKLFKDPVLVRLIDTALVNNKNLKTAIARIEESQALLSISKADFYPSINYGTAASSSYNTSSSNFSNSIAPVINVSYKVDLWGQIRTLNDIALQNYLATEEAYKALTISIISATANAYISLRDLDNRLNISEKTAQNFLENLEVMQARFNAGFISEVDLAQAKIQVIEAKTAIEVFDRSRRQIENAISILLGSPPMDIERGLLLEEQISLPEAPTGFPSDLLNRRPDIVQSERNLHAQTLRIGVAESLKYPSLTLSANMGVELINPSLFFADLTAQLFGPIFNGKRIEKGIEIEKARTKQLLNTYQNTFLIALREVEDAMIATETYYREYNLRKEQMELAKTAAHLSWVRYDGGLTSYLEVLDLQTSQFNAELKASDALKQQLTSLINLYDALGGGWIETQKNTN
ncbi:MAG: efflux transporter outer membrane subunit [Flavobacteriaceae bacterium]|nr:efflux transporter outer membrane subunit [Flavobacteriaceae bacterium]